MLTIGKQNISTMGRIILKGKTHKVRYRVLVFW